jgi:hypothetical protein
LIRDVPSVMVRKYQNLTIKLYCHRGAESLRGRLALIF